MAGRKILRETKKKRFYRKYLDDDEDGDDPFLPTSPFPTDDFSELSAGSNDKSK